MFKDTAASKLTWKQGVPKELLWKDKRFKQSNIKEIVFKILIIFRFDY